MVTFVSNVCLVVFIAFTLLSVAAITLQLQRAVREFRTGYLYEDDVTRSLY